MISLKDVKMELILRLGSSISLLTTAFTYPGSIDHIYSTHKGPSLIGSASCGLFEDLKPHLLVSFIDVPGARRGIILGIKKGDEEVLGGYGESRAGNPAEMAFDFSESIRGINGNSFSLETGDLIRMSAYEAIRGVSPRDLASTPDLITNIKPIADAKVKLLECPPS